MIANAKAASRSPIDTVGRGSRFPGGIMARVRSSIGARVRPDRCGG